LFVHETNNVARDVMTPIHIGILVCLCSYLSHFLKCFSSVFFFCNKLNKIVIVLRFCIEDFAPNWTNNQVRIGRKK